jgi:hypothetical protein
MEIQNENQHFSDLSIFKVCNILVDIPLFLIKRIVNFIACIFQEFMNTYSKNCETIPKLLSFRCWYYLVFINVIVSFYNLAVIWLMQLDVFYSWRYIPSEVFEVFEVFGKMQGEHFWSLFVTVFPQAIVALVLSFLLIQYRHPVISLKCLWLGALLQILIWLLSAVFWGRWQGQIAIPLHSVVTHSLGPANFELYQTLMKTHWLRVLLIPAYWILAVWIGLKSIWILPLKNEQITK